MVRIHNFESNRIESNRNNSNVEMEEDTSPDAFRGGFAHLKCKKTGYDCIVCIQHEQRRSGRSRSTWGTVIYCLRQSKSTMVIATKKTTTMTWRARKTPLRMLSAHLKCRKTGYDCILCIQHEQRRSGSSRSTWWGRYILLASLRKHDGHRNKGDDNDDLERGEDISPDAVSVCIVHLKYRNRKRTVCT